MYLPALLSLKTISALQLPQLPPAPITNKEMKVAHSSMYMAFCAWNTV